MSIGVMGVEIIPDECSYCYMQRLKLAADKQGRDFRFNPATNLQWPKGVQLRSAGISIVWFSEMPTECHCDPGKGI